MCDLLKKKAKRSFVEAWLSDDRYKSWIRKVPSNDSLYHCIICKKDFSCNTCVSRHADSACHNEKINETNFERNNDANEKNISFGAQQTFRQQWLDIEIFKPWLREVSHDKKLCFCAFCEIYLAAKLSNIYRHAESEIHIIKNENKKKKDKNEMCDKNINVESLVPFDDEKKAAEIRYAAFIAEKNISFETAQDILTLFKEIGKDSKIIKGMTMNEKKCKGIISNVLCPIETNRVVDILQNNKFSIFIDETSDISNQKWMTFLVRYVDPETLDSRSQLVKLINIDAKNSSAEKLFDAFLNEMWKLQIPFQNIIAMSCDNASVMVGKYSSFKTKLKDFCKNLLTFSCPCHSAALVAHSACNKIPDYCEEFVKKVATFINSSPKRSAIFEEFAISFQETNRKILKLSDTRWLSRYSSIERLLEYWNTLFLFLTEIVVNEKTKSGEYILSIMQKPETKAYLLFLKHILYYFNSFNLFFQSLETRIQVLNRKSLEFLCGICRNFLKPELLSSLKEVDMPEFDKTENQISINEIYLGKECQIYLNNLITEGHADIVANIRRDCLQFYVTAAQDICKRLPIRDAFLSKLKVCDFNTALRDSNRESSFRDVSYIVSTFGGFDDVTS